MPACEGQCVAGCTVDGRGEMRLLNVRDNQTQMRISRTSLFLFTISTLSACAFSGSATEEPFTPTPADMTPVSSFQSPAALPSLSLPLPLSATWQIQYTGEMDYSLAVDVYNLDLFETDPVVIAQLHQRGIFVMCYFSAGSYEDWRPDVDQFPLEVLGKPLEDWEGEMWLDIRRIDQLKPVMSARLELALEKKCDGVDPDNINGYANDTGFPLTPADQSAYNIFLANRAHTLGLSIGLKNDLDQIPELVHFFDWALNEECFYYKECDLLMPFIEAGKPVFVIEYELKPDEFCSQAVNMKFSALQKNWELDAYRFPCN